MFLISSTGTLENTVGSVSLFYLGNQMGVCVRMENRPGEGYITVFFFKSFKKLIWEDLENLFFPEFYMPITSGNSGQEKFFLRKNHTFTLS